MTELPKYSMSDREIEFTEPAPNPCGLSAEELATTEGAVAIAKHSLKNKIHLWNKNNHDIRQIDVGRFVTERVRLNTETDQIEVDYFVHAEAIEGATDAELRALYRYCVHNDIEQIPRELKLFVADSGAMPNIRGDRIAARDRAFYGAVRDVKMWTSLNVWKSQVEREREKEKRDREIADAKQSIALASYEVTRTSSPETLEKLKLAKENAQNAGKTITVDCVFDAVRQALRELGVEDSLPYDSKRFLKLMRQESESTQQ